MVEIPQGAEPEIRISSVSWETQTISDFIVPVQLSVAKIPGAVQQTVFTLDNEYYNRDAFMPSDLAYISDIGEIRGHRFALIEIAPMQYNPVSGEVRLMTSCEIHLNLPGSDMSKTSEMIGRYSSPAFEQLWNSAFINYGSYTGPLTMSPKDPEGYLIIVYDSFYDEILPLADLKQNKGMDTTVTKTSDIPGGPTRANIEAYIEEAYLTWAIPPTYVLLVGDVSQIPNYVGSYSGSATDLYYVTITTPDYFPDMFIGRFSANAESHVTAIVDKTLTYEQALFPTTDWIKKAAFLASTDNYWISEGTHNYVISNYLIPNGYTCDKLYTYTYGATTQDVHDALNDGRSLCVYSGHGGTTAWYDGPYFDQGDVNGLHNTDMYPFVCSHACLTGQYNYGECFGETWIRAPNKGGIAFWGSSTYTYWDEDDILEKKMFSAWWDDNIETIGGMTDMGLYYTYQYYGGGGLSIYYLECYNILGDPSIKIWREEPGNYAPAIPAKPTGRIWGVEDTLYTYTTSTTDPEGDQVYYQWDWGDGQISDWLGPYDSGVPATAQHAWSNPGRYYIKVKAKDTEGAESDWSEAQLVAMRRWGLLPIQAEPWGPDV